jgi:hypothetical protein
MAAHYHNLGHTVEPRNKLFSAKVLSKHNSVRATQIAEAIWIQRTRPSLNRKLEKPDLL